MGVLFWLVQGVGFVLKVRLPASELQRKLDAGAEVSRNMFAERHCRLLFSLLQVWCPFSNDSVLTSLW